MGAAPEGPRDNGGGFDPALRQACDDAADFLHRPADQHRLLRIIVRLLFGGAGVLAWRRMAASMAKASMTSETCRFQPCQERVSLWSRPSSFLAVSKLSSMGEVEVAPVWWTPTMLLREVSLWPRRILPMRRSSGARWSSWFVPGVTRPIWLASLNPRPRRSAIGWPRPIGRRAAGRSSPLLMPA